MLSGLSQATKAASISLCFSCEQIAHWPLCRLREAVADLGLASSLISFGCPSVLTLRPMLPADAFLRAKASVDKPQTARCAEPFVAALYQRKDRFVSARFENANRSLRGRGRLFSMPNAIYGGN